MNQSATYDWETSKILDDVTFTEEDASIFRSLLGIETPNEETSTLRRGTLLKGRIVELTKDFVVVDVGLKSEGLVPINEFRDMDEIKLGTEVEVMLEAAENDEGQIVLSREKARHQRQWEHIVNHCEENSIVHGEVVRKVKGGLMVDIGIEAFLPGSQIDNKRIANLDEYIGQRFDLKILKINLERKNIVVSRREILEEERLSKKQDILATLQEGDLTKGVVKNITDFGVFLDLDGIDGLLHITDMTWKRIRHPSEMVQLGDELEVMILSIDHTKGRVALGLKQKESNPWEDIERRFPAGTHVKGKIVNMVPYGAFIEIEPGIEGLIHVSEMSWVKNVTDPNEILKKGDEVEAIVLSIQKEEGKVSLGIKQLQENPWDRALDQYSVDKEVEVEVKSLTNYGAFVGLEPGIDGLIHISDFSWIKKVSHPSEMLQIGDKVKAAVLSIDRDSRKITLGIKQLTKNPWESIEKSLPVGTPVKGKVVKVTAFGAFVELEGSGLEALVHVTELSNNSFSKVEEIVSEGDMIEARVVKVDSEHKKISLSMKDEDSSNNDKIVISDDSNETPEEKNEGKE